MLCALCMLAEASGVSTISWTYNSVTQTLTLVESPVTGGALPYGGNASVGFSTLQISNVILGANGVITNSSVQSSTTNFTAPANNSAPREYVRGTNGQANTLINNVMIGWPAAVSNTVELAANVLGSNETVAPEPNVTFKVRELAAPVCHVSQTVDPPYNGVVSVSNSVLPCAVNVTVNAIPKRDILLNVTPGNSVTDNLTGVTAVGIWPHYAVNESNASLGSTFLYAPVNYFSIRIRVPTVNDIIHNQQLLDQVFSVLATVNCQPNNLDTFGAGNDSWTWCIDYENKSIYDYVASYDLQTHNTYGLGQAIVMVAQAANTSGAKWEGRYNTSQQQLYGMEVVNDPSNTFSPANELAVCQNNYSNQNGLAYFVCAMVILAFGIYRGKAYLGAWLDSRRGRSQTRPAGSKRGGD